MNERPYVIVGNSVAAMGAVAGIRRRDTKRPITVISRETEHVYSRPLISYLLGKKVDETRMSLRPEDFYRKHNVEAMLGVEVTAVDQANRTLHTSDGKTISFGKLLITTGGKPIVPTDVPGMDDRGVFTFTTWQDARAIRGFIDEQKVTQALVVGGGLIGLKSVEALVALGIRTTLVELAPRILSVTFDETASDLASTALKKAGVDVRCGTTVSRIETTDGRVSAAVLRDGSRISCSLVICAIGVRPDTTIVQGTTIEVDRGILVNDTLETSVAGIFAAGDVVQARELLSGKRIPIAIFPNAYRQGLIAGINMAGGNVTYRGGLAMNAVEVCGLPTISVGLTDPKEPGYEVLASLDRDGMTYRKVVLKDDRVVGMIFVGRIERAGIFTGLIRDRVDVGSFKDTLLTDEFGLISLPEAYRKHVVSGAGIEV